MKTTRLNSILTLAKLSAVALAVGTGLAGCGGSTSSSKSGVGAKSPDQILAAAKAAASGAASVHVAGSIINGNKPISLDMELVARKGASGHIAVEGLAFDIVEVEHAFYLKGSQQFYEKVGGAAAAQKLQGKWLKVPSTSGEFASLGQLTKLSQLVDAALAKHGKLVHGPSGTIGGEEAVSIMDPSQLGTLYVAASGTPYPLEISKSGKDAGKVTFDRWNQPVTLSAPAGAINIDQLQSGH